LVRADDWTALRALNFGRRTCANPLTAAHLLAEVARYDATGAAEVGRITRARAGVEHTAESLLALYGEVIRAQATAAPDAEAEARAAAEYFREYLSYPFVTGLTTAAADRDSWKASAE